MTAKIVGVGKALPRKVLTNHDLEQLVDTSDEWIVDRTGIHERRQASDDEGTASLGAEAATMALQTAGVDADRIDLIICATMTPDGMFPASASLIQDSIGARNAAAFDVNAACVGFLAALGTGTQFINAGVYDRVLVIGSEVLSRIVDWTDRKTCVLFGDGAGAVVLEKSDQAGPTSFVMGSDGSAAKVLYARGPASPPDSLLEAEGYYIVMDGREVFRFAVRAMEDSIRQSVAAAGLSLDNISYVLPHQANKRIIAAVGKALALPPEKMLVNVESYGNTSSASIPLALCEAWEEGRLKDGDIIVMVAFGGGLAWGASVVEWNGIGSNLPKAQAESGTAEAASKR